MVSIKLALPAFILSMFALNSYPTAAQSNYELRSPDRRIEVRIRLANRIRYDVLLNGKPLLQGSTLSLKLETATLGLEPRIMNAKNRTLDQWIEPVVRQKSARLRENFNELRLEMQGNFSVVFRVYNEGVAYRFETNLPGSQQKILNEEVGLNFAGDYNV